MKIKTALLIISSLFSATINAAGRCDAIASSLIQAAMITPDSAYDFRPVKPQIVSMCEIGSNAAAKGENINQAIIDNLKDRNAMAKSLPDKNREALKLADLAFQLGFDTYMKK